MSDKILQMFFDIGRWTKAIEKGVGKDIRKDQLIRLADERTLLAMADAMRREVGRGGQVYYLHNRVETIEKTGESMRFPLPTRHRYPRTTVSSAQCT